MEIPETSRAGGRPSELLPGQLAVNEAQAIAMLGLNDGRTERAAKNAFWQFRRKYNVPKLPGGVFSVRRLEQAAGN